MASLDELLATPGIVVAPGAHDALSARLAARAGARAVYLSGFGVCGASFGLPDLGLVGAAEMTERVRAVAAACAPVPLVADGDDGHGGPLHAARLARAYEAAGAQCIQIEDQAAPKRCGHLDGKSVLPTADAAAKIRAAVGARASTAFKVMARTDARATHGLDEALRRGEAFLRAGADLLFVEAPRDEGELRAVAAAFRGVPLVANMVEDGKTPYLDAPALEEMGFKVALFPVSALLAVTARLERVYAALLAHGRLPAGEERVSFTGYAERIGTDAWLARAAALARDAD
ncbi:MAG: isocitrate lyase/phosphoenolpyruvate mutase family protein [Myxococcales bacterium]|nr:isocitrate lyase/phosphoenolpyruvate mutase family protein [Myxococcales bacterium]